MKQIFFTTSKHYLSISITALLFIVLGATKVHAQTPDITSMSPSNGNVGSSVTIGGTGFNATAGNNVVYFGATKATVTSASATGLVVTVDSGATYSPISVLNRASSHTGQSRFSFVPTFTNSYFIAGDINFKPKVDFSALGAGNNPYIAAIGDIDGDGKPDLVVNNRGDTGTPGNVIVYRNVSSPGVINSSSFTIADTISIGTVLPSNVKLGDFDGDGKLDMVYSDLAAAKVSVYRNTSTVGSVSFSSVVDFTIGVTGAGPNVLAIADFDGDGWMDISFSASNANNIVVMHNTGSGSITSSSFSATTYAVGVYPIGISAADFDGDGKPDIAVACSTSNVVSVIRNTSSVGSVSFATRVNFTTGTTPVDLQCADINSDGRLDLLVTNNGDTTLSIFANAGTSGTIAFASRVNFRTGALPVGIGTGDIDGDGKVDVVVTNPGLYPYSLSVYRNLASSVISSSSLAARDSFIGGGAAYGVTIGDLDGDGYPDMVTANPHYFNTISILRNYPLPMVDTIAVSGSTTICHTSGTVTLSNTISGGTWISSNTTLATVSTTGFVTALAPGIDTIIYRVIAGGDTNSARKIITIEPTPAPGTITGASAVCVGTTTTLADTATGGTWSSSAPAVASVTSGGVVRGNSIGTAIISYSKTNSCGTFAATKNITVSATPAAGTITGSSTVCVGSSTTLTDTVTGGTWTSASAATAFVSSAGVVSGVAAGSTTITYTVNNGCGTAFATAPMTVNPAPSAGTITGTTTVCQSASTTLSSSVTGGAWTTSNAAIASVSTSGGLTGIAAGSANITYTMTNSCGSASTNVAVTVNPLPRAGVITGASSICIGAGSTTLADTAAGGVWSSTAPAVATVNATGTVTAVAAGTTTISYTVTNSCGVVAATLSFSVDTSLPAIGAISGPLSVCASGATITLTDAVTGGSWSSSASATASVNTTTGLVRGITAGSVTITYTVTNSCGTNDTTRALTVNPLPVAGSITGPATVCVGVTISLNDTPSGGTWTSSSPATASVTTAGAVRGNAAGTATIHYAVTNGCGTADSTKVITVNPQPSAGPVTGLSVVCVGATITLGNTTSGGTWTSSSPTIASITTAGVVRGNSPGTATIHYTITNSCGTADSIHSVTVNPTPNAGTISGPSAFCQGATNTFTETATGGTWSSSNSSIASVNTAGDVTGVAGGSATISYTVTNSCGTVFALKAVTVNPLPRAGVITGPSTACTGTTVTLTDTASGGSWASSNTAIATVNSTGLVTALAAGAATITYTVTNSCGTAFATKALTVIASPNAGFISGPSAVCELATITLTDGAPGGTWSSSAISVATVNTTGSVFGVAGGTATISYAVSNSCGTDVAIKAITVNPLPIHGTVSGTTPICNGATTSYSSTVAGGTWTTNNPSVASITSAGSVTGVALGSAVLTYTVTNGCGSTFATTTITVISAPAAGNITGASSLCEGTSTVETGSASTITSWSFTNGNATLGATSGSTITINGVSPGVDTLTYIVTNACGSSTSSRKIITVLPAPRPGTIYGPASMCSNDTTVFLGDTTASATGFWSTPSGGVTIDNITGQVTAYTSGTKTMIYTVPSAACGNATATFSILVRLAPHAGAVDGIGPTTGSDTICVNRTDTLNNYGYGDYWSSSNISLATVTVTGGIVSAFAAGLVTIYNIDTNSCGADTFAFHLLINGTPDTGTISGIDTLCAGLTTTLTESESGGMWSSSNASVASITTGGLVHAVNAGTAIITYTLTNGCGTSFARRAFHVVGLPDFYSSLTANTCDSVLFFYTPQSHAIPVSFTWSRAAVAGISNSPASGSGGVSEYLDNTTLAAVNVDYRFITAASGCVDTNTVTVRVSPFPSLTSAKRDSICSGARLTYLDTESTGSTTIANWSRAAVTGITPATATGSHTISENLVNTTLGNLNVTYVYILNFNGCQDTDQVIVKVAPSPVFPHITTHAPTYLCSNTYDMNFGTADITSGVHYDWFASGGASVWATGTSRQYCLVNFNTPGYSWVYLKASLAGSGCVGIDSFGVNVTGNVAGRPHVIYFNNDFVCEQNDATSYQWGYDDVSSLDSTVLTGETNQNYTNIAPDFAHKYYWVITDHYGCIQKTYYKQPTGVLNINSANAGTMQIVPNPSTGTFKITLSSANTEKATVIITNTIGQKVKELTINTNDATEVALDEAAGVYFITANTKTDRFSSRVVITK